MSIFFSAKLRYFLLTPVAVVCVRTSFNCVKYGTSVTLRNHQSARSLKRRQDKLPSTGAHFTLAGIILGAILTDVWLKCSQKSYGNRCLQFSFQISIRFNNINPRWVLKEHNEANVKGLRIRTYHREQKG